MIHNSTSTGRKTVATQQGSMDEDITNHKSNYRLRRAVKPPDRWGGPSVEQLMTHDIHLHRQPQVSNQLNLGVKLFGGRE